MAKFCGGFKFDESLKIIDGVLCTKETQNIDPKKIVTGCGQMWDGNSFKVVKVDGYRPCITLVGNAHDVKNIQLIAGNCGVGLDANFFTKTDNVVSLTNGYILTVIFSPENASVKVLDKNSTEIDPIATGEKYVKYCLSMLDEKYSVTVEADGFTGKSQTIMNDKSQGVNVALEKA